MFFNSLISTTGLYGTLLVYCAKLSNESELMAKHFLPAKPKIGQILYIHELAAVYRARSRLHENRALGNYVAKCKVYYNRIFFAMPSKYSTVQHLPVKFRENQFILNQKAL